MYIEIDMYIYIYGFVWTWGTQKKKINGIHWLIIIIQQNIHGGKKPIDTPATNMRIAQHEGKWSGKALCI